MKLASEKFYKNKSMCNWYLFITSQLKIPNIIQSSIKLTHTKYLFKIQTFACTPYLKQEHAEFWFIYRNIIKGFTKLNKFYWKKNMNRCHYIKLTGHRIEAFVFFRRRIDDFWDILVFHSRKQRGAVDVTLPHMDLMIMEWNSLKI